MADSYVEINVDDVTVEALLFQVRGQVEELCQKYVIKASEMLLARRGPSAPWEVPGFRTGNLSRSFSYQMFKAASIAKDGIIAEILIRPAAYYWVFLQEGTSRALPRPFVREVAMAAWGFS